MTLAYPREQNGAGNDVERHEDGEFDGAGWGQPTDRDGVTLPQKYNQQ